MPYIAEFSSDGRTINCDCGTAPDDDKDAVKEFEEQAIAMVEATGKVIHLQVLQDGRVVHSKSYGAPDAYRT